MSEETCYTHCDWTRVLADTLCRRGESVHCARSRGSDGSPLRLEIDLVGISVTTLGCMQWSGRSTCRPQHHHGKRAFTDHGPAPGSYTRGHHACARERSADLVQGVLQPGLTSTNSSSLCVRLCRSR